MANAFLYGLDIGAGSERYKVSYVRAAMGQGRPNPETQCPIIFTGYDGGDLIAVISDQYNNWQHFFAYKYDAKTGTTAIVDIDPDQGYPWYGVMTGLQFYIDGSNVRFGRYNPTNTSGTTLGCCVICIK